MNVGKRLSQIVSDFYTRDYYKYSATTFLALVIQPLGKRVPDTRTQRYSMHHLSSQRFEQGTVEKFVSGKVRLLEVGHYALGDPGDKELFEGMFNISSLNDFDDNGAAQKAMQLNLAFRDMHSLIASAVDDSIDGLNYGDVVLIEVDNISQPIDVKLVEVVARRVIDEIKFGSDGVELNPDPPDFFEGDPPEDEEPDDDRPDADGIDIFFRAAADGDFPQVVNFVVPAGSERLRWGATSHGAIRATDSGIRFHKGLDIYASASAPNSYGMHLPLKNNFESSVSLEIESIKYFKLDHDTGVIKRNHKNDFIFAIKASDINYGLDDGEVTSADDGNISFFEAPRQSTDPAEPESIYLVESVQPFLEYFYDGDAGKFHADLTSATPEGYLLFHINGAKEGATLAAGSYSTAAQVASNMIGFAGDKTTTTITDESERYIQGTSETPFYVLDMTIDTAATQYERDEKYIPPIKFIPGEGFLFSSTKTTDAGLSKAGFNIAIKIGHRSLETMTDGKDIYMIFYHFAGFPGSILNGAPSIGTGDIFGYLGATSIASDRPHYHFEVVSSGDDLFDKYIDALKREKVAVASANISLDPTRIFKDGAETGSRLVIGNSIFSRTNSVSALGVPTDDRNAVKEKLKDLGNEIAATDERRVTRKSGFYFVRDRETGIIEDT